MELMTAAGVGAGVGTTMQLGRHWSRQISLTSFPETISVSSQWLLFTRRHRLDMTTWLSSKVTNFPGLFPQAWQEANSRNTTWITARTLWLMDNIVIVRKFESWGISIVFLSKCAISCKVTIALSSGNYSCSCSNWDRLAHRLVFTVTGKKLTEHLSSDTRRYFDKPEKKNNFWFVACTVVVE